MKTSSAFVSLVITICVAVVPCSVSAGSGAAQQNGTTTTAHADPPPANLKVLPKDSTAEQVKHIMRQWESDLGVECDTCHARDPKNLGPNGRPRFNYADDSKPEKAIARVMYTMLDDINSKYLTQFGNSGIPITCGTCHRGRVSPEPFDARAENGGEKSGEASRAAH